VPGSVEGIFTAVGEALPMRPRDRVMALPGIGLVGDRYATANGYWSGDNRVSRDLTLIEAEVVEDLATQAGLEIQAGELRRNVVTRGIRLNDLVGVRFGIGNVLVEGTSPCAPCVHLARVTGKSILRPLAHRGGLRANILTPGEIGRGDAIQLDVPNVGVGVVVRRDGRYLLGRRLGRRGHGTWSTPGGVVMPGESVLACAVRELSEETELAGRAPRVIGRSLDVLEDAAWCSVFVAVDVASGSNPQVVERAKCEAWGWFEPSQLPAPLFAPVGRLMEAAPRLAT
jgi:ADP-ribose pyrophosphatase YjhB (NUDIX family)